VEHSSVDNRYALGRFERLGKYPVAGGDAKEVEDHDPGDPHRLVAGERRLKPASCLGMQGTVAIDGADE
jgi:hypothetical protein